MWVSGIEDFQNIYFSEIPFTASINFTIIKLTNRNILFFVHSDEIRHIIAYSWIQKYKKQMEK